MTPDGSTLSGVEQGAYDAIVAIVAASQPGLDDEIFAKIGAEVERAVACDAVVLAVDDDAERRWFRVFCNTSTEGPFAPGTRLPRDPSEIRREARPDAPPLVVERIRGEGQLEKAIRAAGMKSCVSLPVWVADAQAWLAVAHREEGAPAQRSLPFLGRVATILGVWLARACVADRYRLLAGIMDASPDGMIAIDRAQIVREINRAALHCVKRARSETIQKPLEEVLGVEAARAVRDACVAGTARLTIALFDRICDVEVSPIEGARDADWQVLVRDARPRLRREAESEWRVSSLTFLRRLGDALASDLRVEHLVMRTLDVAMERPESEAAVFLLAREGGQVLVAGSRGAVPPSILPGTVLGAAEAEQEWADLRAGSRTLVLPLEHARRSLGLLVLIFKEGTLEPRVGALWQSAARSVGVALHAAEDYERLSAAEIERGRVGMRRTYADRLASLGALAGGVAHEINNPVAFIMLAARQIGNAARRGDVNTVAELAREVEDASARIGRIVGELKLFSRIPQGVMTTPIDVNRMIETAVTLTSTAVQRVAKLDVAFGELPLAPGSFATLCPAFVNILLNAAEAVAAPGVSPAPLVTVRTATEGGAIVVTIADNGAGMVAETMDRAFEPFFTTKPQGDAAGLWLAIAQDLVQRSGGYIQLTTAQGEGSTFRIVLPLDEATQDQSLPRMLVIDDDPRVGREIANRMAGRFAVDVATSAEVALTRALSTTYAAIFCDVFMPDRSGPAIHAEVARASAQQAARFVFIGAAERRGGNLWQLARATGRPIVDDTLDGEALDAAVATALDQ